MSERNLRQTRPPVQIKEPVQIRAPEIQVGERDVTTGARECECEVRSGCGLSLRLERARDHDYSCSMLEVREFEVRPQHPESLGLLAPRGFEHDQTVLGSKPLGRSRQPREQRHVERLGDLLGRPHPCIERFAKERESKAKDEPDQEAEHTCPERTWLNLCRAPGRLDEKRVRGLQRLERAELLHLVLET